MRNTEIVNIGKDAEKNGTHSLTEYKLSQLLRGTIWQCLVQMKTHMLYPQQLEF